MKILVYAVLLAAVPLSAFAVDTAYTALRVIGKQNGEDALNRVLEVHGRQGSPEPQVWKVLLSEPSARGGVREYEVQRGHTTGERAPSGRGAGGPPLDLNKLNIDSDGAFTIANQEAQKAGTPFDRIDYTLTGSGRPGLGAWHLEFYEGQSGKVGSIDIAADTGTVLRRNLNKTAAAPARPPVREDHVFVEPAPQPRGPVYRDDRPVYSEDRPVYRDDRRSADRADVYTDDDGPGITDIFGKITRHFDKRSRQIKNFFTGQ